MQVDIDTENAKVPQALTGITPDNYWHKFIITVTVKPTSAKKTV
jgi:hypothetical protein